MSNTNWSTDNILDQTGRVIIITGATSGLGKEAARILAGKNATVVMAVRNTSKGEAVSAIIRKAHPKAVIDVRKMDLSSLASVKAFTDSFLECYDRLDVLINNAGIMWCPKSKTEDGFEMQMGTNHLGHFALTAHLMPILEKTPNTRIVATSSLAHKTGNVDFSDLNWEAREYKTMQAYADSKIANLYFTYELARRIKGTENSPLITAAHPGWTTSDLQRHSGLMRFFNSFFSQELEMGVLPTLRAGFDPNVESGDFFGPSRFFEMHGYPVKVQSVSKSHDLLLAEKLWDLSEQMTGVIFS